VWPFAQPERCRKFSKACLQADLLERASISIAKGNYNMLRDNRTLPAG